MSTIDLIKDTHNGKLTRLGAFNKSFEFTNGLPKRIEMLIFEIDDYTENVVKPAKEVLYMAYEFYLHSCCDFEFKTHYSLLIQKGLDEDDLFRIHDEVENYLIDNTILFDWDIPSKEEIEAIFYPDFTKRLEQLKSDLHDFIDNPTESNPKEPPTAKDVWGLVARYNFLDELGVLSALKNLSETEKAKAISQILGCNLHNAKKLKNGTYPTNETKDEQIERTQLINLIKRT
jgi:hypothetical protein